eukprot:g1271.t1
MKQFFLLLAVALCGISNSQEALQPLAESDIIPQSLGLVDDSADECNGHGSIKQLPDGTFGGCRCDKYYLGSECQYFKKPGMSSGRFVGRLSNSRKHAIPMKIEKNETNLGVGVDPTNLGVGVDPTKCAPHGVPVHKFGVYRCLCAPGWHGLFCDKQRDSVVSIQNNFFNISAPTNSTSFKNTRRESESNTFNKSRQALKPRREICDLEASDCQNGSTFDEEKCRCRCDKNRAGVTCGKCAADHVCTNGRAIDPKTCECTKCERDKCAAGKLNEETCQCEVCRGECYERGFWNSETCMCVCVGPWDPSDNCLTCPPLDCSEHGEFNPKTCACDCKDFWTGLKCDECPSVEELVVAGAECGKKGFELTATSNVQENCRCRDSCPTDACVHGKTNADDCSCDCSSAPTSSTADVAPSFAELSASIDSKVKSLVQLKHEFSPITFWTGPRCDKCRPDTDTPCPMGRAFNYTSCQCSDDCDAFECANGGVFNEEACVCECPWTLAGAQCEKSRDGSNSDLAAVSCRAIMAVKPDAGDGIYWLQPNPLKDAFTVRCDMKRGGGGWIEVAKVGEKLSDMNLNRTMYRNGFNSIANGEYLLSCEKFNSTLLERMVEVRVIMGNVTDLFKPVAGSNLCEMLGSNNHHLWKAPTTTLATTLLNNDKEMNASTNSTQTSFIQTTEETVQKSQTSNLRSVMKRKLLMTPKVVEEKQRVFAENSWITPEYVTDPTVKKLTLGGCARNWPSHVHDPRGYISFWGGARGGCCHYQAAPYVDQGQWGRKFEMHLREITIN